MKTAQSIQSNLDTRLLPLRVVNVPPPPKRIIRPECFGSNRGARGNIAAIADFNRLSTAVQLEPVYIDPVPGRALALKEEAALQGVVATDIEARGEDVPGEPDSLRPRIIHIDRASGIASMLRATRETAPPVLGYLIVKLPLGKLFGLAFVLEPKDELARSGAITFFEELARASERNTSEDILGEQADPSHRLLEPSIREWFRRHTVANLTKIVAALEPTSNTFEITEDGNESVPLFVAVRTDWSDPTLLAAEVMANPAMPVRKGTRFCIAEVVQGHGVRLHHARHRTDGRVSVAGADTLDRAVFDKLARTQAPPTPSAPPIEGVPISFVADMLAGALELHAERQVQRAEQQLQRAGERERRATLETLSPRNPILTTD